MSSLNEHPTLNPAPETPGVDMPGSFPIPKQGVDIAPGVQGVASDAFKTAKEYAQFAAQGAQTAVQSAGGKVGEYLPTNVSSYISSEPDDILPSQATPHPSGPPGDKSVDQAVHVSPIQTTTNNPTPHHPDPLERHTGYIPGTLQDDTSLAKLPEERRLEGLPSHDDESSGRLGKSGGVGALPGSAGESSVALLPDERKERPQRDAPASSGASTDASTRTLPGSAFAPSPLGQNHFVPQTIGREHAFSRDEEKVFGANANKDLDVPDPVDNNETTHTDPAQHSDAGGATQMGSDSPKKSGFIHKVKGEIKVLSGKMSHNETKIEEGRKMMGKN